MCLKKEQTSSTHLIYIHPAGHPDSRLTCDHISYNLVMSNLHIRPGRASPSPTAEAQGAASLTRQGSVHLSLKTQTYKDRKRRLFGTYVLERPTGVIDGRFLTPPQYTSIYCNPSSGSATLTPPAIYDKCWGETLSCCLGSVCPRLQLTGAVAVSCAADPHKHHLFIS